MTISRACSALLALALFALSGCYHSQVVVDPNYNAAKAIPDSSKIYIHIFGLIGVNNNNALDDICANGVGMVENKTYIHLYYLPITIEESGIYCN